MDWLRDHSYLAAWLALPVAIIIAFFQNRQSRLAEVDWSRIVIYLAFLISLAVMLTPMFDETARGVAKILVFAGLGFLIVDRRR
jgi:L-asparagine transporter-like permease